MFTKSHLRLSVTAVESKDFHQINPSMISFDEGPLAPSLINASIRLNMILGNVRELRRLSGLKQKSLEKIELIGKSLFPGFLVSLNRKLCARG